MVTSTTKSIIPHQWQTRVCLRSNEGFPYEIDRQILIDSSAFFADLFDLPWHLVKTRTSSQTASTLIQTGEFTPFDNGAISSTTTTPLILDEVIDIDLSTKDLRLFFDFMQVTARFGHLASANTLLIDVQQARILLPLMDQYDCESMHTCMKKKLNALSRWHPWETFHIACDRDDLELGRAAIDKLSPRRLHDFVGSNRCTEGWKGLLKLSEAWQSEFLRLLLPGEQRHDTILLMELDPDAYTWSWKFNPKEYQEGIETNGKRKRI